MHGQQFRRLARRAETAANHEAHLRPPIHTWLQWALGYAEQGWRVFPLQQASKEPLEGSGGKHDATRDPDQILAWAEAADSTDETPNLGIVPPDGCLVIDVDPRDGGALPEGLPATMTQRSGGGGWHVVVRVGDTPVRGTMGPGIQIKTSTNGYIVAEPSIHDKTGKPYEWDRTTDKIAACPAHILERIRKPERTEESRKVDGVVGVLPESQIDEMAEALAEALHSGQKHATVLAYGGWCAQQGVRQDDVEAIVRKALELEGNAEDIEAGVDTSTWAYSSDTLFGWQQLSELLTPEECAALEATSPYRRKAATLAAKLAETWQRVAERVKPEVSPGLDWFGVGKRVPWSNDAKPTLSLVEGLPIYRGESNALIGFAGAGKTPTMLTLAHAVASGETWLGRPTIRTKTVYITYESPEMSFEIGKALAAGNGWPQDNIEFVEGIPGWLSTPDGRAAMCDAIVASGAGFVLIETYASANAGLEVNDASYAQALSDLARTGAAVLVSIHTTKAKAGVAPETHDISGTGNIGATIKGAIGIHRPDAQDEHLFELTCARARNKRFRPLRIRFDDVAGGIALKAAAMPAAEAAAPGKLSAAQVKRDEERIVYDAVRRWAATAEPEYVGMSTVQQAMNVPATRESVASALEAASKDGPPLVKIVSRDRVLWYRPTTAIERKELRPLGPKEA